MNIQSTRSRYSSSLIAFHWLMVLLLIAVFASIQLRELYPRGSDLRSAFKTWHFMLGLSVFCLVWLRLLARFSGVIPAIVPPSPRWQMYAANTVELTLYLFMIGMPLLGWSTLSALGAPIPFFGFELPPLMGVDKDFGKELEEIHGLIGTAGYYVIGLHTVAALVHHYVQKDNVLTRILPWRSESD